MAGGAGGGALLLPCFAAAALSFTFLNHAPLIPLIVGDLGITHAQAGWLSSAMFASGGAVSLPMGGLTDRLGPRRVMAWSMALQTAATLGLGLAPSLAALLLMKFLGGVGFAAAFVAASPYVQTITRGDRQYLWQGFYGGCVQLGTGAGIFVLPWLATALGWRGALAASALPVAVAWLLWLWRAAARPGTVSAAGGLGTALRSGTVWRLGVAHTATFSLAVMLGTWVTVYFIHEFGLPLRVAGMLGSLGLVLGLAARPAGAWLVTGGHVQPRTLILLALVGAAAAVVALALPARPLALALAAVVGGGAAMAMSYAAVVTLATRAVPAGAGAALGVIGVTCTVGVMAGAPLVGSLYAASGDFTLPLLVLALLPATGLLLCRRLPRA